MHEPHETPADWSPDLERIGGEHIPSLDPESALSSLGELLSSYGRLEQEGIPELVERAHQRALRDTRGMATRIVSARDMSRESYARALLGLPIDDLPF
jgi:hypothetical protein